MTIAPWRTAEPTRRQKRRALSPLDLLETAQQLAYSASSFPGLDDPCERCWRTIVANEQLEAWVVAWPVGGAIELHDHGNSAGAVVVARGTLTETSVRPGTDRHLVAASTSIATGDHVVFGPDYVHDFVNGGPGPALSVHVYSPALRSMTYFDWSDRDGLIGLRTENYPRRTAGCMTMRADDLVTRARRRIHRVQPSQLGSVSAAGGLIVDIRSEAQRRAQGDLEEAVVVERNVLEWRLDPHGEHRLPQVRNHGQWIVIVCSEGYASSLAAASLVDLGFENAGDLEGGFHAWRSWSKRKVVRL